MAARIVVASGCLLATLVPAWSLVLSAGGPDLDSDLASDWDDWLIMSEHKPHWLESFGGETPPSKQPVARVSGGEPPAKKPARLGHKPAAAAPAQKPAAPLAQKTARVAHKPSPGGALVEPDPVAHTEQEQLTPLVIEPAPVAPVAQRQQREQEQTEEDLQEPSPKFSVGIFCSGTLKRYFLQETTQGLIAPLVQEGHQVDYFVALNMGELHSYHPGADKLSQDPKFNSATESTVRNMIISSVEQAGGRAFVKLFDKIDIHEEAADRHWINNPGNNMLAKWNVLKKLKPLQTLYEHAEKVEQEEGTKYDFMIFLDDDSIWLQPFSLSRLLRKTAQYKKRQLFTLFCGPDSTTITPDHGFLTEYVFIANRSVAEALGKQYSVLTGSGLGHNVFNLEQFSWRIATKTEANIIQVPVSGIPMQRAGRKIKNGTMTICLHKKCMDWPEAPENFARMNPLEYYPVCNEALWKR